MWRKETDQDCTHTRRITDRGLITLVILSMFLSFAGSVQSSRYYAQKSCRSVNTFKSLQNDSNGKTKTLLTVAASRAKQAEAHDTGKKLAGDKYAYGVYSTLAASYHTLTPDDCGKLYLP